jgi:hypothetical protein
MAFSGVFGQNVPQTTKSAIIPNTHKYRSSPLLEGTVLVVGIAIGGGACAQE